MAPSKCWQARESAFGPKRPAIPWWKPPPSSTVPRWGRPTCWAEAPVWHLFGRRRSRRAAQPLKSWGSRSMESELLHIGSNLGKRGFGHAPSSPSVREVARGKPFDGGSQGGATVPEISERPLQAPGLTVRERSEVRSPRNHISPPGEVHLADQKCVAPGRGARLGGRLHLEHLSILAGSLRALAFGRGHMISQLVSAGNDLPLVGGRSSTLTVPMMTSTTRGEE
jgi:hypothetical protein